jgi:arylsulfatase A-like enzyme
MRPSDRGLRRLLHPWALAALAAGSLVSCSAPGATLSPAVRPMVERPNVVLILSDDHRSDHLSCAGHPVLETPHLDRLAAEGTRFVNAFVTTPICASSRATALTGLDERSHEYTFGMPGLDEAEAASSYPVRLREAGYRTGFVGKFGLSAGAGYGERAFDTWRPMMRAPYWKEQADGTRRHVTDLIGDEAVAFVATEDARPWCLSISFNAGHAEDHDKVDHYPWPDAEEGRYEGVDLPQPVLGEAAFDALPPFLRESMGRVRWGWRWDTPTKYDRNLRAYYRLLSGMDRNVGRVLAALEETGQLEDTLILFMGDNGYAMAERGLAGKWTHFEESLRVPLLARGPGVAIGALEARTALNTDLAPTVLAAAGVEVGPRSGRPLQPLLAASPATPWRMGFRCEHGFQPGNIPRWVGWRTPRMKYARYTDQDPPFEFLHDLTADPLEQHNLAADPAYADWLERLRALALEAGEPVQAPRRG